MGVNVDLEDVPAPPGALAASFTGDDPTDDEIVATGAIRTMCGWHIAGEITETRKVDCDGGRILPLRTLHLVDVAAVAATDAEYTGTPLDIAAVRWSEAGLLSLPTWWPVGFRAVEVTFTHGYDPVPPELVAVTKSIARHALKGEAATPAPVSSYTVQQGDVTRTKAFAVSSVAELAGELSGAERMILSRYALGALP